MLWGGNEGHLEVRAEGGSTRLTARFPYGAETELAPGRLEVIAPRAFADRIDGGDEIHLLSGHDFNRPLASRSAGTLTLPERTNRPWPYGKRRTNADQKLSNHSNRLSNPERLRNEYRAKSKD